MQPRTVSASSLANWEDCPAKFKAANVDRVPEVGKKKAANTGTTFHYAVQLFVDEVYLKKITQWADKARLDELLREGYRDTFNSADYATEEFLDAQEMIDTWYKRTDLSTRTVVSVEVKDQYLLQPTSGPIPMTYIMDRLDMVTLPDGSVEFHVVDYKTQRMAESFDDIENKLQAKIYALAVYLKYGKKHTISSVWVHLDLIRHSMVGVEFTRDDCVNTYLWLLEQVDIIRSIPDADAPEILGPGCSYCPRKGGCGSLKKHLAEGGVVGKTLDDLAGLIDLRQQLDGQMKGIKNLMAEIDSVANRVMKDNQIARVPTPGGYIGEWDTGKGTRQIASVSKAATILGPEIMSEYAKLNIGDVDKLLASGKLTKEQENDLRKLITMKYGDPGLKVKRAPKPRTPKGTTP